MECSVKGDVRFSPQFAKVKIFGSYDTIENHYLSCQKTVNNRRTPIGEEPHHLVIHFMYIDKKYLSSFLKIMWIKYLDEHPELISVLKDYDMYTDMFDGVLTKDSQADILKNYIQNGREYVLDECLDFLKLMKYKKM